jgi:hypothetical protein
MKSKLVLLAVCCLLLAAPGQGSYMLTTDQGSDINPSACNEWSTTYVTCMVWQTNRNGNWDVYSEFCTFLNGNGWGPETPVCADSAEDVNPAVACCNDSWDHPSFWCIWERRESPVAGGIWASFAAFGDSWRPPQQVGRYVNTAGDSAWPGVVVIRNDAAETAWAVWACRDTDAWYIEYSYNADGSWITPGIIAAQHEPIHHVRLGKGRSGYRDCPLVVWESRGDIYASENADGYWIEPEEVAHSTALDRNPDVVSCFGYEFGPWIVWESTRDGDTAVFGTAEDTFSIARRLCDTTGSGNNYAPCGTPAEYPIDYGHYLATWVSDRDGNANIYSGYSLFPNSDICVDPDPAVDVNPAITTFGFTMNWFLWQSNRSGNWDIWGSYIYVTGVAETSNAEVRTMNPATILGGVPAGAVVFDAMGRRVVSAKPGVYFVGEGSGRMRKVVLQR